MVSPELDTKNMQQIPNLQEKQVGTKTLKTETKNKTYPDAQFPAGEPPFAVHSELVKQVPFRREDPVLPLQNNIH